MANMHGVRVMSPGGVSGRVFEPPWWRVWSWVEWLFTPASRRGTISVSRFVLDENTGRRAVMYDSKRIILDRKP